MPPVPPPMKWAPGTVAHDGFVPLLLCQCRRIAAFGKGPDLVGFEQYSVGAFELDTFSESAGSGHKEIIPHQLTGAAQFSCQEFPILPALFGKAVFNGVHGVIFCEFFQKGDLLRGRKPPSLLFKKGVIVNTVMKEGSRRRIHGDGNITARSKPRLFNG